MKIFQIWIESHSAPDVKTFSMMQSIISNIPDGSDYTLYSTKNYYPKDKRVNWIDITSTIDDMLKNKPELKWNFKTLPVQIKSDLIRYYIPMVNDIYIYLDCDIVVKNWPDNIIESGLYFCPVNKNTPNVIDGHVFCSNKDISGISSLFAALVGSLTSTIASGKKITYSFTFSFLNKYFKNNKVFKLDVNKFDHNK